MTGKVKPYLKGVCSAEANEFYKFYAFIILFRILHDGAGHYIVVRFL